MSPEIPKFIGLLNAPLCVYSMRQNLYNRNRQLFYDNKYPRHIWKSSENNCGHANANLHCQCRKLKSALKWPKNKLSLLWSNPGLMQSNTDHYAHIFLMKLKHHNLLRSRTYDKKCLSHVWEWSEKKFVPTFVCIYVSMYSCIYVWMYVCIYVCMYACIQRHN